MTGKEFNDGLHGLINRALNSGKMDVSQVIGSLEIAKLNVDRIMLDAVQKQQAKEISKTIVLPPNGIRLPRREG